MPTAMPVVSMLNMPPAFGTFTWYVIVVKASDSSTVKSKDDVLAKLPVMNVRL